MVKICGCDSPSPTFFATEVPTSKRTQEQAEKLGIKLATLDTQPKLDVAGADLGHRGFILLDSAIEHVGYLWRRLENSQNTLANSSDLVDSDSER